MLRAGKLTPADADGFRRSWADDQVHQNAPLRQHEAVPALCECASQKPQPQN